jgi:L-rhamnonate dehydratase
MSLRVYPGMRTRPYHVVVCPHPRGTLWGPLPEREGVSGSPLIERNMSMRQEPDDRPASSPVLTGHAGRITEVRVCQPIAENSPPDWRTSMGQILVSVETDAGLTGYGVGGGGAAGMHVIREVLRDLLCGRPVEPVEQRWEEMFRATLPFGRKGLAIMAISGVDLALWDLRAKAAGQPVARLLDPEVDLNRPIPTYRTVWDAVPDDLPADGSGIKLHLGMSPTGQADAASRAVQIERLVERLAEARRRIGPDRMLMVDAWMSWDLETTLAVADAVVPLDVAWLEEPLPVDDLDGYRLLARDCPIPIAGGEHEFTAHGFRELIEHRLHAVLQPDICWVGGLTEMVKIFRMAAAEGLWVVPHRGAELWGLHVIAGLSERPLAESGRDWLPWVGGQPEIIDGTIRVPERPGFGADPVRIEG